MKVQQAYNEWASTYDTDENATRDLDAKVTRGIFGSMHFKHVLEIGCGTGKNTTLLSDIAKTVLAIDFSENMLVKAKAKVMAKNVSLCLANITERWPCANQALDLIVCNLVLEHIQDLEFIFAEAERTLDKQGRFFVSELHPYRQYQEQKANFQMGESRQEIEAHTHHTSDYLNAAQANGLQLVELKEWWHEKDRDRPPRLVSLMFQKAGMDRKYISR